MKLKIKVEENKGKFILTNQFNEKKTFNTIRELINELMHYSGNEELKPQIWQLLRFYSSKEK